MSKMLALEQCNKDGNGFITIRVTTEGTLNVQALYEAYIRLGIDAIILRYESQISKPTSE